MKINYLDHINLRTTNLQALKAFYQEVLGFREGPRPASTVDGAWLYCGKRPAVHLVAATEAPDPPRRLALEHFAFAAEGLAEFLAHLRKRRIAYRVAVAPGSGIRQVNFHDADGNRLHVDFAPGEKADLTPYEP
jgi:catechol 2,3-dioxygenase-like lactoylglutathione lyase family enzyme